MKEGVLITKPEQQLDTETLPGKWGLMVILATLFTGDQSWSYFLNDMILLYLSYICFYTFTIILKERIEMNLQSKEWQFYHGKAIYNIFPLLLSFRTESSQESSGS